jgi:tRNA threonylcarbamoyladenosine biosynthesis protein TsaB
MKGIALAIDGSTYSGSAALLRDGKLIDEVTVNAERDNESGGRGEALVPLIASMLVRNKLEARDVEVVICGAGPGSFTSLRVAASVAKGIAFASGAKMYAVRSLLLTPAGAANSIDDGNYLAVVSAMRGEFFALPLKITKGVPSARDERHSIVKEEALRGVAGKTNARIIGPGQEIDASPHARGVASLFASIIAAGPVELPSWEPDYGRLAEAQVKWEASHGRPLRA